MTSARVLLGLAVLTTLLVVQFGLYRVLERFAVDPLADGRIPFARNTIEAALASSRSARVSAHSLSSIRHSRKPMT